MKAYLLYNRNTPTQRIVERLGKELEDDQVEVELLDADSPSGIQMVESYDILGRPAVALIRTDGTPVQIWQGEDGMPTTHDVAYLAHQ
jgi:hypothetical protein